MCEASSQGGEQLKRTTDKLLILGTANTKDQAPIGDPSFTTWAVSPYADYPGVSTDNVDVLFEMHPRRYWGRPEIGERLTKFNGPVVMQGVYPEIPNSVAYPLEAVLKEFMIPAMGEDLYITNTISYMVAYGYIMGYKEFHLYGVHMSHSTEYGYQKPSCEYFLGYLSAKGRSVVIPKGSALLHAPYLYGYKEPWEDIAALGGDIARFEKQIHETEEELNKLHAKRWKIEGMRDYAKMVGHVKGMY